MYALSNDISQVKCMQRYVKSTGDILSKTFSVHIGPFTKKIFRNSLNLKIDNYHLKKEYH